MNKHVKLDPVTGPLSREEFQACVAAPFGGASKIIRKHDPFYGLVEGEMDVLRWRVRPGLLDRPALVPGGVRAAGRRSDYGTAWPLHALTTREQRPTWATTALTRKVVDITNCYIDAARVSRIASREMRSSNAMVVDLTISFFASSTMFMRVASRETALKTKFQKVDLLNSFPWSQRTTGCLKIKSERQMHAFKRDDIVTIFQMHPSKGLLIEGKAVIRERVVDVDEQYLVTFINEPNETYERFVDRQGQGNPQRYVADFNRRIGKVA